MITTAWYRTEAEVARGESLHVALVALLGMVAGGLWAWRLTWKTLRGAHREDELRSLGWSVPSQRSILVACLTGVVLAFIVLFVVIPAFPPAPGHRWGPMTRMATGGGWSRHLFALIAVLIAPPVEELVFRGVLFTGLARSWGAILAGVVSTLLFVAGHLPEVVHYWTAIIVVAVLGVATLLARTSTRSLLPAAVLHAAYNGALTFVVYLAAS